MKFTHCTGARGSEGVQVTSPLSGFSVTRRSVEMVRVGTEVGKRRVQAYTNRSVSRIDENVGQTSHLAMEIQHLSHDRENS